MPRRLKLGDLFEVETSKGFGYVQYCHREGGGPLSSGPLIRAIVGLHRQRPADFQKIAAAARLFWTYYPLGPAANQRLVTHVGTFQIPAAAAAYPMLRSYGGIDRTGLIHDWNILGRDDDLRPRILRIVKILNEDEQRLSNASIVSHPVLVDYIEEQYRPETDPGVLRSVKHWTEVERLGQSDRDRSDV